MLTADYFRIAELLDQIPPTVDLHKWEKLVVTKLYQLGFFRLLGHTPSSENLIEDGPTLTMRIVCGRNADELHKVDEALKKLGDFLASEDETDLDPKIVHIVTTISEAISNVTQHAYSSAHKYEYKHICSFWVAATANKQTKTLTVAVYDQGATIPVTYPRLDLKGRAIRFLRSAVKGPPEFAHQYDGTYVRAAMRYGGSRTDQSYRGKGLPQMHELIQTLGTGQMSIRSRGGWCINNSDGRMSQGFLQESIGGTLVEWTIQLDQNGVVGE